MRNANLTNKARCDKCQSSTFLLSSRIEPLSPMARYVSPRALRRRQKQRRQLIVSGAQGNVTGHSFFACTGGRHGK